MIKEIYIFEKGIWDEREEIKAFKDKVKAIKYFNKVDLPISEDTDKLKMKSGLPFSSESGKWASLIIIPIN